MLHRTRILARGAALLVLAVASTTLLLRGCPAAPPEPHGSTTAPPAPPAPEHVATSPRGVAPRPPAASPQLEPPPQPRPPQRLTLRDAWDGRAIPGITVRLNGEKGPPIELVADESGRIEVMGDAPGQAIVVPGPWRLLANSPTLEADADELWLWRPRTALVTVRGDEGATIDPASVSLFSAPGGSLSPGPAKSATSPPGNTYWLRDRGFRASRLEGTIVGTAEWRVEIPGVRGVCVVGFAPGWRPALELVPEAPPDQEVSVVLVLRPTQWVSGHMRSSDGAPVAGARLVLYATRNGRYIDASEEYLCALGLDRGAFGGSWSRGQDTSEQMFMSTCVTGADGSFRVDVRNPGRVLIIGYAPGHTRVVAELGNFEGHRDVELVATAQPVPDSLFVELGGSRIANAAFVLADMGYDDEQPAFDVASDADGRIQSTWLVSGRRYALIPTGPPVPDAHRRPHYFTHENRAALDLAKMSTKYK